MNKISNNNTLKRKHKDFNSEWKIKYFFVENQDKPLCLICNESLFINKVNNI